MQDSEAKAGHMYRYGIVASAPHAKFNEQPDFYLGAMPLARSLHKSTLTVGSEHDNIIILLGNLSTAPIAVWKPGP